MTAIFAQRIWIHLLLAINKQNNMQITLPHTHIAFMMTRPKGIGSRHTHENRCFNCKDSHSKSNDLSSLVIPVPPPLNDSIIFLPPLFLVRQQSSRSSQNKTPDLQASSIPGRTPADPSNTIPLPSTKNRSRNIY